jgi:hypothetical protein
MIADALFIKGNRFVCRIHDTTGTDSVRLILHICSELKFGSSPESGSIRIDKRLMISEPAQMGYGEITSSANEKRRLCQR